MWFRGIIWQGGRDPVKADLTECLLVNSPRCGTDVRGGRTGSVSRVNTKKKEK